MFNAAGDVDRDPTPTEQLLLRIAEGIERLVAAIEFANRQAGPSPLIGVNGVGRVVTRERAER